jgi:hypothetical protein
VIRFRFNGSREHPAPIAFLGLSEANLERLKDGHPVRVARSDDLGLAVELVIYYGKTEVEMAAELEEAGFMPPGTAAKTAEAIEARGEYRHP